MSAPAHNLINNIEEAKVKDASVQPELARVTGNDIPAIARYPTYLTGNGALIANDDGITPDSSTG